MITIGATVKAHTGSTKNGTYALVAGKVVGWDVRSLSAYASALLAVIEAEDGTRYTEPVSRCTEVEPAAPVEVEPAAEAAPVEVEQDAPTYTVSVPGALAGYVDGTGWAQGTEDDDPESLAMRKAWDAAPVKRAGRGHSVTFTGTRVQIAWLEDMAEIAAYCNGFERSEQQAARTFLKRVRAL